MEDEPLRLIEDFLPLDVIGERAASGRAQRSGSLTAFHIWWGRKPQVAARAAVYATLVAAPHDHVQRTAYLRLLSSLCESSILPSVLQQAQRQIAEVHRERSLLKVRPQLLRHLSLTCSLVAAQLHLKQHVLVVPYWLVI